jgi:hypothetical protein
VPLTYSPKSGHIKRDGAVIGRVEPADGGYVATLFLPGSLPLTDPDLPCLLASVRKALEPPSAPPGRVSLQEAVQAAQGRNVREVVRKARKRLREKYKTKQN